MTAKNIYKLKTLHEKIYIAVTTGSTGKNKTIKAVGDFNVCSVTAQIK